MSKGEGLERSKYVMQAETLYSEFVLFVDHYQDLHAIEKTLDSYDSVYGFCLELASNHDVMASITRLHTASHIDFQRAIFCSWFAHGIAKHLNLSQIHRKNLFIAGLLQDVGKYVVDTSAARFISQMTSSRIPVSGHHNLEDAHPLLTSSFVEHQFPNNENLKDLVLHHHAKADGAGYPNFVVESQLGLDDQILIIANEINDRLDRNGGYSEMAAVLPYLKLSSLLYFDKTHRAVYGFLDEILCAQGKVKRVCEDGQLARYKQRSELLNESIGALMACSAELMKYEFDVVVRGLRTNIEKLVVMSNEVGLSYTDAFDDDAGFSLPESLELDEIYQVLPETLKQFVDYLRFLLAEQRFDVDGEVLSKAIRVVSHCANTYSGAHQFSVR